MSILLTDLETVRVLMFIFSDDKSIKISNIHFHTLTMILKDCMKGILKQQRHLLHQSIISG